MAERLADPAEVRAHLLAAAADGRAITYADLLERLGYRFSRPKMRALCAMLGEIDAEAAERGEPELAVLVVRQSDGIPGQGCGWRAVRASTAMPAPGKAPRRADSSRARRRKPSPSGSPVPAQANEHSLLTIIAHPFSGGLEA
jgi:hypothetical protein